MVSKWDKNEGLEKAVTDLWTEGLSALTIAGRLGHGLTRNAVVAKIHRLRAQGMQLRGRPLVRGTAMAKKSKRRRASNIPGTSAPRAAASKLSLALAVVPFKAAPDELTPTIASMEKLEEHHCRWIYSAVGEPGFGFCGRDRFMGLAYCATHAGRAYIPAQPVQRAPVAAEVSEKQKELVE